MPVVRRLALPLLLAACADDPEPPPRPPRVSRVEAMPERQWVRTQAPGSDLEIRVPESFAGNYKVLESEIHFGGPGEPGKRPELIFGWEPSDQTLADFARERFSKFEGSPTHVVLGKGETTVAGMPALSCTFQTGQTRQLMVLFVGHGHRGFVRGISQIGDFAKYGRVFGEAAIRVRYNPQ
jgi:hypothetical protein